MVVSGKTKGWGQVLPFTKVIVTDKNGVIKQPVNGVVSDNKGKYSIIVTENDYLTARASGFLDKRIKVSEVCSQNSCNFDIDLAGKTQEEEEVTVVRPKQYDKPNWILIGIITGIAVVGITAAGIAITAFRRK